MMDYHDQEERQLVAAIPILQANISRMEADKNSSQDEEKLMKCKAHTAAQIAKLEYVQNAKRDFLPPKREKVAKRAGMAVWDSFVASSADRGMSEDNLLSTCDVSVLCNMLRKEEYSECVIRQVEGVFYAKRYARVLGGPQPLRMMSPQHQQHPPRRVVYGQGTKFAELVRRDKWSVVDNPANDDVAVVWERDRLCDFRECSYDPTIQMINRFSDAIELRLASKAELTLTLEKFHGDFLPPSHSLRHVLDVKSFIEGEIWKKCKGVWILKRADLASGFGMEIIPNVSEWWDSRGGKQTVFFGVKDQKNQYVLQKYIERPYLLTGRKFDSRFFFMVASVDPLVVLAGEGFLRLNVETYEEGDWNNVYKHISNIAQNRTHPQWPLLEESLLWTFDQLEKSFREKVWGQIPRIVGGIVRSVHPQMVAEAPEGTFQLFAIDCVVDSDGKVWLTECQINPALCAGELSAVLLDETLEIAYAVLWRKMLHLSMKSVPWGTTDGKLFRTIIDESLR